MTTHSSSLHLESDALQRLLDHDGDASEREYARAHIGACASCAAELELLERQAALVNEWLRRAAFEDSTSNVVRHDAATTAIPHWRFTKRRVSNSVWNRGWLQAAAVLVLLGTPVAASSTVRGWIAERIGLRDAEPVVEVIADPVPNAEPQLGVIRFAPAGGSFDVAFASLQQAGTLEVVAADGSEAVLEISGAVGAGPVVSENALRINNDRTATANYILRVPATVTRVTVRMPGRAIQNIEAMELRQGVQTSLAR